MRRRKVLALGGALGAGALAGCLDALDGSDGQAGDSGENPAVAPEPDASPGSSTDGRQSPDSRSVDSVSDSSADGSTSDSQAEGAGGDSHSGESPADSQSEESPANSPEESPADSQSEGLPSQRSEFDPAAFIDDWQDERVRGTAQLLETEETDEWVAVSDGGCARAGKVAVGSTVNRRLPAPVGYYAVAQDPDGEHEYVVVIGRKLAVGQDDDVELSPQVSFETLRSMTPQAVEVTVVREGDDRTCRYPVYVQDRVQFQN